MRVPLTLVIIAPILQAHQEVFLGTHKSVHQNPKYDRTAKVESYNTPKTAQRNKNFRNKLSKVSLFSLYFANISK